MSWWLQLKWLYTISKSEQPGKRTMQQLSWGIKVHAHISNKNFHMHCKLYLRVLNQRKVKLWFLILNVSASSRPIYSLEEIERKCTLSNSLANKTIYMSSLSIFNLLSAFNLEKNILIYFWILYTQWCFMPNFVETQWFWTKIWNIFDKNLLLNYHLPTEKGMAVFPPYKDDLCQLM